MTASAMNPEGFLVVSLSLKNKALIYDGFNQLTSYQSRDTIATYTYDAQDYRTGKRVQSPAGEEITRYFYEGNRVVLEADASGTITAHNTYSINLASRRVGEEEYYYLYNAHGDVVTLVGMQDGREIRYRYDAFGTLLEVTGDADNSITYAGYQYDSESGLYYLNARYYDSTTARFLTEDTYAGQANDPLSLHRYTYCANNPLRYTDPDGHFWGAALRFLGGAALGAAVELGKQIFIEKRDHIDVKAVIYEMGVGGVSAAIGGVGGAVTKLTTPKEIINGTLKTAGKEALGGFVEDVCFQMFVEGKSVTEIDWGQSLTTSSISGLAGATSFLASQGRMHLDPPSKIKVSEAAALIDNVADVPSHPKANILPEASTKPNRRAVKNAAGGLADAGSAAGSAGRKSKTAVSASKIKSASVKKGSPSLSKNQNKIQSQIVDSKFLSGKNEKKSKILIIDKYNAQNITKDDILNAIDGVTEKSTEIAYYIRKKEIGLNILSDKRFAEYLGYKIDSDTVACLCEKQIFLKRSSLTKFADTVHEGVHALDFKNGVPTEIIGSWTGEIKAYTEERLFEIAAGLPVTFETVDDMMVHIWSKYKR